MNADVYRRAAKEAEKLGDKKLANRFRSHPDFLNKLPYQNLEEYKFVVYDEKRDKKYTFTGKFIGTDPGMESDMFVDNEKKGVIITPRFVLQGTDPQGNEWEGELSPFWISYYDGNIDISGPFQIKG